MTPALFNAENCKRPPPQGSGIRGLLATAATVRVGYASSRKNRAAAQRTSMAAMTTGIGFACLTAALFLTCSLALIALYLGDGTNGAHDVTQHAIKFLAIAGLFQLVDSAQGLANGCLRGLKDARLPMLIAVLS